MPCGTLSLLCDSVAVITLEQLWRGHLAALGEMNLDQRETYQMVFGDPLNWVRMRLGHRSVQTTQLYLHTFIMNNFFYMAHYIICGLSRKNSEINYSRSMVRQNIFFLPAFKNGGCRCGAYSGIG